MNFHQFSVIFYQVHISHIFLKVKLLKKRGNIQQTKFLTIQNSSFFAVHSYIHSYNPIKKPILFNSNAILVALRSFEAICVSMGILS